jgi:hypothetical protein
VTGVQTCALPICDDGLVGQLDGCEDGVSDGCEDGVSDG